MISLVDELPADPDEQLAIKYMWREVELALRDCEERSYCGAPSPDVRKLLQFRYGSVAKVLRKEQGETWSDAVKASIARSEKPLVRGIHAYALRWNTERTRDAVRWFQQRLQDTWPREITFLAEDLPTLHTACVAMDLAPVRPAPVADDPFPAAPLLITGPTGTGKELLACAIHKRSKRSSFGALNCGGLPPELLESELFGHEKGAFTGADLKKIGFVEVHKDGTLFLDEIGDMPAQIQVRLLRFLNNGEYRPVGANKSSQATPRIVSATHVRLDERVAKGEFREDLFHRIRGHRIRLRGLRERPPESTRMLIARYLEQEAERRGATPPQLTRQAWRALIVYGWPGNMRELKYVGEQIVDRAAGDLLIDLDDLKGEVIDTYRRKVPAAEQDVLAALAEKERGDNTRSQFFLYARIRHRHINEVGRTDTRAASLRRAAALLERLAKNLGLENQVEIHVKALQVAAEKTVAQEFKGTWLAPLKEHAAAQEWNIDEALANWEKEMTRREQRCDKTLIRLQQRVDKASNSYALATAFAGIVRAVETGDLPLVGKLLHALEVCTEAVQVEPLKGGARYLIGMLKDLSPEELKSRLQSQRLGAEDDSSSLSWHEVKDDPQQLRMLVAQYKNRAKLARDLGIQPRTLYRKLHELGLNAHDAQRKQLTSPRQSTRRTGRKRA